MRVSGSKVYYDGELKDVNANRRLPSNAIPLRLFIEQVEGKDPFMKRADQQPERMNDKGRMRCTISTLVINSSGDTDMLISDSPQRGCPVASGGVLRVGLCYISMVLCLPMQKDESLLPILRIHHLSQY